MSEDTSAQPTPTNYQRTAGGHLRWQPPTPQHLQEMLPAYEIMNILGQGGMGAVYKGRQKSLDRIVAIKILPPEAADNDMQFVERFKNEARTMAKMNHPAIVHVYDFGETSDGQLYIVMEFIDGTDVAKMIQSQGKLPEDYALSITAHVCDALQYAHTHGVVHRDIKPANILINMEGQIKVADFGLAKATDPNELGLTKTNMAMGTPDFVSPEALMPGVPLDGRADLYAVGVMLYNMLTGMVPRGAFRMPGMTHNTDMRFDRIIGKAMEMDRENRYQTALDLRRDLDVILTTPIAQQPPAQSAPAPVPTPQQSLPEQPASPPQRSANAPVRNQPAARPSPKTPVPAKKSSSGMIYVLAAVVAVVAAAAFMLTAGGKKPAPMPVAQTQGQPEPVPTPPSQPATPPAADIFTFAGHRYQMLTEPMPWTKAKAKAETMGGHLATLTTAAETDFMRDKLAPKLQALDARSRPTQILLGAYQATGGGPWQWITGEPFEVAAMPQPLLHIKDSRTHYLTWNIVRGRWDYSADNAPYFPLVEWDDDGTSDKASPTSGDPSRQAAEYLVKIGGECTAIKDGKTFAIKTLQDIPPGAFSLVSIHLDRYSSPNSPLPTDADFQVFKGLKNLRSIRLREVPVKDSAFTFLADNPDLEDLQLEMTDISDEVLKHIESLPKIRQLAFRGSSRFTGKGLQRIICLPQLASLIVYNTQFDDAAVEALSVCQKLSRLHIENTAVTDQGLRQLQSLKTLTSLTLRNSTKISAPAIAAFRAALPQCKVD